MPRSYFRFAAALLILAALASGVYFARKSGSNPQVYSNDFNVYYFAAREVIEGRDPYQNSLGAWTPYLYLPLLAEIMIPLACMPLPVAAYIWFLISAASVAAAAWMSASLAGRVNSLNEKSDTSGPAQRWLGDPSLRQTAVAAGAVAIVIRFVLDNFAYGQVNTVVAGLAVAHIFLFAKNRKAASGLALAFAASIKLTPAVLIAYHVAKREMKFAALCAALLAVMTTLSFLPFGASAFETFVGRTIRNEQGFDLAHSGNQSLRGAIARIAEEKDEAARRPSNPATLFISIALLALSVLTAVVARNPLAAAAPFFCCLLLLSPLSWKAHFVALTLPIAYLLSQMFAASGRRRYLIGVALVSTFVLFNLTSPKIIGARASDWADSHSLVFAGALLIYFACVCTALVPIRNVRTADEEVKS